MNVESVRIGKHRHLHAQWWTRGDGSEVGTMIVVHGLGDHGGRFGAFARRLARRNWGLLALDLPGHGRSEGRRGAISSYDVLLESIASVRHELLRRDERLPQILLGHSMGGNLVINYALRRNEFESESTRAPDGLVLLGPMLMPPKVLDRNRLFAAWATGHLLRWLRFSRMVDPDRLTRDPAAAERLLADPRQHSRVSLYLATQLLAQGRFALDQAREIQLPTLIAYGESDTLIDRAACDHLACRMNHHANVIRWPGGCHDLIHDVDADAVADRIIDWSSAIATEPTTGQTLPLQPAA